MTVPNRTESNGTEWMKALVRCPVSESVDRMHSVPAPSFPSSKRVCNCFPCLRRACDCFPCFIRISMYVYICIYLFALLCPITILSVVERTPDLPLSILSIKSLLNSSPRSPTMKNLSVVYHFPWVSRSLSSISIDDFIQKEIPQLPRDVMEFIANKLTFEAYLRFSGVLRSMSIPIEGRGYKKPWVMLSNKPGEKTRPFYSPLEGKTYDVKLPKVVRRSYCCGSYQGWLILAHKTRGNFIYNPITNVRFKLPTHEVENVCYWNYDRTFFVGQTTNYKKGQPRTHRQHLKRCPYFLSKVVLSSVPSLSSSCSPLLAAAITENHKILITVCHPGQLNHKWRQFCPAFLEEEEELLSPLIPPIYNDGKKTDTVGDEEEEVELIVVNEDEEYNDDEMYERNITDILFYKGDLYAVNTYGKLVVLSVTDDYDFSVERIDMHPLKLKRKELSNNLNVYYLVESCHGELLLVVRIRDKERLEKTNRHGCGYHAERFRTKKFVVFRLDDANGKPFKWVRTENLGDQVLFLGQNNSMSVSSSNIQGRRNCIYFTDCFPSHYFTDQIYYYPFFYKDVGMYNFDDDRVKDFVPDELDPHLHIFKRQPILFTPNPW